MMSRYVYLSAKEKNGYFKPTLIKVMNYLVRHCIKHVYKIHKGGHMYNLMKYIGIT